jgi:hypothetical protein
MELVINSLASGACGLIAASGLSSHINKIIVGSVTSASAYIILSTVSPTTTAMLVCGSVAGYFLVDTIDKYDKQAIQRPIQLPSGVRFYSLADLIGHVGRCRQRGESLNLEFIPAYCTYCYETSSRCIAHVIQPLPSSTLMADHIKLRGVNPGCMLGLTPLQEEYLNLRLPLIAPAPAPEIAPCT